VPTADDSVATPLARVLSRAQRDTTVAAVQKALEAIPDAEIRTALWNIDALGRPLSEVAKAMGYKARVLQRVLDQARHELRRALRSLVKEAVREA
jgi:DNA-directed RNA polymerase specialized sigma24 family protein